MFVGWITNGLHMSHMLVTLSDIIFLIFFSKLTNLRLRHNSVTLRIQKMIVIFDQLEELNPVVSLTTLFWCVTNWFFAHQAQCGNCKGWYTPANHMRIKWFANSLRKVRGKLIFCEPEANMGQPALQFPLCLCKKWTNFGSQPMVCELFADSAAQVRNPIHTYAHLVCMWVPGLRIDLQYNTLWIIWHSELSGPKNVHENIDKILILLLRLAQKSKLLIIYEQMIFSVICLSLWKTKSIVLRYILIWKQMVKVSAGFTHYDWLEYNSQVDAGFCYAYRVQFFL